MAEDVFPVAPIQKALGGYVGVPEVDSHLWRARLAAATQDQAQLDGWLRDGSAAHVETLCEWV